MNWKFTFPGGPCVTVGVSNDVNVDRRLSSYREGRGVVPAGAQAVAETYAEATYLKYRSAHEVFGVTVGSLRELEERLGHANEETLLLLEAAREDMDRPVGALLLRVAWTGDLVIDFVGTNPAATKYGKPPLRNGGVVLVYAALKIGKAIGAPLVYAETARHSRLWWDKLLAAGEKLIKVDDIPTAVARIEEIVTMQGQVIIEEFKEET